MRLVLCAAAMATSAFGDVISVPGDAPTIQAGIDLAKDGDTVLVASGVYVESLDMSGKAITLQGQGNSSVINPGDIGTGISCDELEGPDTVIKGFKITGGTGADVLGDGVLRGGAMVMISASPTIMDCTFDQNTAGTGGAMYIQGGSPTMSFCSMSSNQALDFVNMGGAVHMVNADVTMDHVGFFTNTAMGEFNGAGGAIGAEQSTLTMVECHLHANVAGVHGGAIFGQMSTLSITATPFHVNEAVLGGAIAWLNGPYELIECLIYGSQAETIGGAVIAQHAPGLLVGCDIGANTAGFTGGAMFTYASDTVIRDTMFIGNGSGSIGGAIAVLEGTGDYANCLFVGNEADQGGAIVNQQTAVAIANSTFVDNTAAKGAGVLAMDGIGSTTIANSIFRGEAIDQIGATEGASLSVSWSNIEGGFDGEGNIDADPMFVAPDDPDEPSFALMPGSPSADAGNNSAVPEDVTTDIAGEARFADDTDADDVGDGDSPIVDMGAYETQSAVCAADCNGDGALNALDFVCFQGAWVGQTPAGDCNGDGSYSILDFVCYQGLFMAGCP